MTLKIAVLVKNLYAQMAHHATSHLIVEALKRDHRVDLIAGNDLMLGENNEMLAQAADFSPVDIRDTAALREVLMGNEFKRKQVELKRYDLVLLRFNPAEWSRSHQELLSNRLLDFMQILKRAGGPAIVNDPQGLAFAGSKMHLMMLPQSIRPRTLVSRDPAAIKEFLGRLKGPAILKPVRGYGGSNVFYVDKKQAVNLNQMLETILHRDYCVAQEFEPASDAGEKRLMLLDGEPIREGKKVAIYGRKRKPDGDIRHNLHAGAEVVPAQFTKTEAKVVKALKPYLLDLGLRLVGVDIVGDKVLEVNAFCPGGIENSNRTCGMNTGEAIIKHFETAFGGAYTSTFQAKP